MKMMADDEGEIIHSGGMMIRSSNRIKKIDIALFDRYREIQSELFIDLCHYYAYADE